MWAVGAAGCYLPRQHATRQAIVRITATAVQLMSIAHLSRSAPSQGDHLPLRSPSAGMLATPIAAAQHQHRR
jgi:hypothetical protein